MAKRQKGKIARTEWEKIARRHQGGESLASIARDYGCTAPAIRYIVNRPGLARRSAAPAAEEAPRTADSARSPARLAAPLIDRDLRARITNDVAFFLVAVENAADPSNAPSVDELRDAVERLLRSASRMLVVVERLQEESRPARYADPARKTA